MDVSQPMRKILLFMFVILAGRSIAAPTGQIEAPLEIVSARFGIFDNAGGDELILTPSAVVPLKVGQRYGWAIEVRTSKRTLEVREEYVLPAKSKPPQPASPLSESLSFPTARRALVSQRQLAPQDEKIYGEMSVGPNDSAGHRLLQIFIEGQPGPRFEYDLQ